MGQSCRKRRRGKSQFKKGSDWWKFSIWNRVMGSQLIRIQLRKILREIVAGKSCRKLLQENLVGNSCGKILQEIIEGKSCGKSLWEILAGKSCRKSCGKLLWENLAGNLVGNCCGKILQEILCEILAGKSCGKSCRKILREILQEIPHTYISKPFLNIIFKICNSSRSTSFSLVNVKNLFLKPILNQFSHMTHQIEA